MPDGVECEKEEETVTDMAGVDRPQCVAGEVVSSLLGELASGGCTGSWMMWAREQRAKLVSCCAAHG